MSAKNMILKSDNVLLREFKKTDIHTLAILANNKNVSNNLRDAFPSPYTISDAEEFINNCKEQNPTTTFAIEWNSEYVGNIGLIIGTDVYRKSAEIGYFIGEPFWNNGITSNAIKLITEYGFDVLELKRIFSGVFEYNIASMRVLEKNGYKKDGVFLKAIYKNGKFYNEHRYYKLNNNK